VILFFALQRVGAILVPLNFRCAPREIDHVLRDSGARLLIHHADFAATTQALTAAPESLWAFESFREAVFAASPAEAIAMNADFESPVMILYTSGTTGAPKGALVTHKMLFWNSVNTGLRLQLTPRDRTLIFHPFFHTSGWNVLTTPFLHHGACVTLLKKFDPDHLLELCEEEGTTVLFGVPTMMDRMARSEAFPHARLDTVRFAVVGGEPMPVGLIRTWAEKGIPVRQGYGLTEFGPNVFSLQEEDALHKIGSIGFPNFYVEARIVDGAGRELHGADEVGELCLRGPVCTPGYWQNEEATRSAIVDGWFHTGDLVRRDAEGYFYVVGRKKEMFISGAENVYPAEIEQYLRTKTGVWEVAVVGVPDPRWGEVGKCFYSTADQLPIADADLRAFCQLGLAKYKVPKYFVHLPELPKGDSGKVLRRALPV
jgi:fatty-acyl-CoA synthase